VRAGLPGPLHARRRAVQRRARARLADNHRRFAALAWAGSLLSRGLDGGARPDIVHTHDWQAGLLPAYERLRNGPGGPRLVHTIHNLAYAGNFDAHVLHELGLPDRAFTPEGVEFYGRLSFMKAGLVYADRITTVSRTYAEEIQTAALWLRLRGPAQRAAPCSAAS
jgi:starch synthase